MTRARPTIAGQRGFSLLELLVSTVILAILMAVLVGITNQTSVVWRQTSGKLETFREARVAFESMTRRLSQATLNTYWGYDNPTNPKLYLRQSELRFISGPTELILGKGVHPRPTHGIFFQAPLGVGDAQATRTMDKLLNNCGYFLEFGDDSGLRPGFIDAKNVPLKHRVRLMEYLQPAESTTIYKYTSGNPAYKELTWLTDSFQGTPPVRPLADNIIALVILPKLSVNDDPSGTALAPNYLYRSDDPDATNTEWKSKPELNSKNQLPPILQVTMVAIDEASAVRLQAEKGSALPDFGYDRLFKAAAQFEDDLMKGDTNASNSLEQILMDMRVNYRIFSTNVSIAGAKWSTSQTAP